MLHLLTYLLGGSKAVHLVLNDVCCVMFMYVYVQQQHSFNDHFSGQSR